MNTESRAEFEAFISLPPHEKEISRFPDDGSSAWPGSYKNLIVDLAWDAWQASRQALEGEPAAIVDRVGIMQRLSPYTNLPEGTKLYTHPASQQAHECDCCGYPGHDLPKWREVLRNACLVHANHHGQASLHEAMESLKTRIINNHTAKAPTAKIAVQQFMEAMRLEAESRKPMFSQDVTGAGDEVSWSAEMPTKPARDLDLPVPASVPDALIFDDEPNRESLESIAYVSGWNDCREKVLEYTPTKADVPCEWKENGDHGWKGSCGVEFYLEDGGPSDNGMKFCIRCGSACAEISGEKVEDGHDDAM